MVGCAALFFCAMYLCCVSCGKVCGEPEGERCNTDCLRFDLGSLLATNHLTLVGLEDH